jgi:CheY-like chemotaxis protein
VPVIMCTSKNQETDKVWGMRQGARDYVVKPVDPDELVQPRSRPSAEDGQRRWPTSEALRELQGRLAERLQEARELEQMMGWLAVEAAGYPSSCR